MLKKTLLKSSFIKLKHAYVLMESLSGEGSPSRKVAIQRCAGEVVPGCKNDSVPGQRVQYWRVLSFIGLRAVI